MYIELFSHFNMKLYRNSCETRGCHLPSFSRLKCLVFVFTTNGCYLSVLFTASSTDNYNDTDSVMCGDEHHRHHLSRLRITVSVDVILSLQPQVTFT